MGDGGGEDSLWFGEGRWGVAERVVVVGRGVVERGGGVVEWGGREWEGEEGKKGGVPPLFHAVEETRKIPDTLAGGTGAVESAGKCSSRSVSAERPLVLHQHRRERNSGAFGGRGRREHH